MKPVESLVASPFAGAIGWTLIHSLWEGAIVSAVLAALLALLRTPRMRYLAACAAMLAIVVLFGVTLKEIAPRTSYSAAIVRPVRAVLNRASNVGEVSWRPNLAAMVPWLTPVWVCGVLFMLTRHLAGCLAVQRLRVRGVCSVPESWQRQVAYWSGQLRISRQVQVLESCLADAPMVLGYFRPLILLPVGLLAGLSCAQVESIFLHELAHIRRHDYLINTLQGFVEGLFFYHPAVWWISRVMRSEREHCCDDVAVANNGRAYEYALALAALEERRTSGRNAAVAATGGSLVKRIHRLLYPKTNGGWAPFLAATVLVVTCAATLAAWPLRPDHRDFATGEAGAAKLAQTVGAPARLDLIVFTGRTLSIEMGELDAFKKRLQEELNAPNSSLPPILSEIHTFWQMHGFYRVTVKNVESSPLSANYSDGRWALVVDLEEGPQYRVSAVQWEGATVFSPIELRGMMPVRPGDIFNPSKAEEGEEAIRTGYANRGYPRVAFTAQRLADDDNDVIIWIFKIKESRA